MDGANLQLHGAAPSLSHRAAASRATSAAMRFAPQPVSPPFADAIVGVCGVRWARLLCRCLKRLLLPSLAPRRRLALPTEPP